MRAAFDQSRAAPLQLEEEETESLLAVRISQDAFAIRLDEITCLATDEKIVALPSPTAELLGLVGIRGVLLPVYSLPAILGYGAQTEQSRWLVKCGTENPVALAFSDFEGCLRIPSTHLHLARKEDAERTHVKEVARGNGSVRAVVSIPLVRKTIQELCRRNSTHKG